LAPPADYSEFTRLTAALGWLLNEIGDFAVTDPFPSAAAAGLAVDWETLDAATVGAELRGCPQTRCGMPRRRLDHVRMGVRSDGRPGRVRALPELDRKLLFTAACCTIGQAACLRTEADGRISGTPSLVAGAIMARRILWRMKVPFRFRRAGTALVRHHLSRLSGRARQPAAAGH